MDQEISARDALKYRTIPQMTFSDGTDSSLTPAPHPLPNNFNNADRARLRFVVEGNAVVTGGAGGLGLTACRALLEHGASGVAILDVNSDLLQAAKRELQKDFPSSTIITKEVNVKDDIAVKNIFEDVRSSLGSIDSLLCFAGIVSCQHAIEMGADEWRRVLDINTTGSFLCAQAAAKAMIDQGRGGSILFTASISAHRVNFPQPQVAYNVSKAAVLAMKDSLAAEWARFGIRVNSISPGYSNTILNQGDGLAEAKAIWTSRTPMGRIAEPSELTGAVILLVSNAGSYITGADIVVDGGIIVL